MHYATLISKNPTIHKYGMAFHKGKETPISDDVANLLRDDARFSVRWKDDGTLPVKQASEPEIEDLDGDEDTSQDGEPLDTADAIDQSEEDAVTSGAPKDKRERLQAIREAADAFSPDDESAYTNDGKPSAVKLTEVLGWQVTALERDEAMNVRPSPIVSEDKLPRPSNLRVRRKTQAE